MKLASLTPGTRSASPARRRSWRTAPGPTIGAITSPLRIARQRATWPSACSAALRCASDASVAALIAPTLVPQ